MKPSLSYSIVYLFLFVAISCAPKHTDQSTSSSNVTAPSPTLVIHAGAGSITKGGLSLEEEKDRINVLENALNTGYAILEKGGSSLEAIEQTIRLLEDSPYTNAGKGSVFTNDGKNELDASIMDGRDLNAGAVAGVKTIKNPISAAIKVMNNSPHVLLSREGAEYFAKEQGLEIVDPKYFYTQKNWDYLQHLLNKKKTGFIEENVDYKYGTVGAVALDKQGNIAAGTSTGGMTNKRFGRIGDSPIIGAGTYANNKTCGVSSTGHGEYFIRNVVAYDISAMMEYGGKSLKEAANFIINKKLKSKGGVGGVIAVDKNGNIAMPFNTNGMYRGYIKEKDKPITFIYRE